MSLFSYLVLGVYLLGILLPLCRGCVSQQKRMPWAFLFFWILALFPIVCTVHLPRDLDYDMMISTVAEDVQAWPMELLWTARLSNGLILVAALSGLLKNMKTGFPKAGYSLWLSFVFMTFSSVVSAFAGTVTAGLSLPLFRPLMIFTGVYTFANRTNFHLLRYVKWGCLAYVVGSTVAAVTVPNFAVLTGDPASLIGISRLYGVASHPNSLGPIAFLYLALEMFDRETRWFHCLIYKTLAVIVLVWSQSKTIWVISIVALVIWSAFADKDCEVDFSEKRRIESKFVRLLTVFLIGVTLLTCLVFAANSFVLPESITTFTGRTELWAITLGEWQRSPIFGYGPDIWNEAFRARHFRAGHGYAGQAHNMFIQTLGESGLLGFLALTTFLVSLFKLAINTLVPSRGLSITLALFLFIRCFTETPLRTKNLDETMFVNMLIFAILIAYCSHYSSEKVPKSVSENRFL